jgi:hypothetical protein
MGTMTVGQRSDLTPYDRWGEGPLLTLLLLGAGLRLAGRGGVPGSVRRGS